MTKQLPAILFLIFFLPLCGSASGDYQPWPEYPVAYEHLDVQLEWDGFDQITGRAEYRIRPYFDHPKEIRLHAPGHSISAVEIEDDTVEYSLENDELIISTAELELTGGQYYILAIQYETVPQFGFITGADDIGRTSLLPKSVRHWLPGFDHPRTRLTFRMNITVPAGYSVAATGRQQRSGGTDQNTWRYESDNPVSLSELSWSAGYFQTEEAMFGNKRVRLFWDEQLDDFETAEVLDETIRIIRDTERVLNQEFPGDELQLVILRDDFWETRSAAKGLAFMHTENGDLNEYLTRAVLSQWFGGYWKAETWQDAEALGLLQQLVAEELALEFSTDGLYRYPELRVTDGIYHAFNHKRNASWTDIEDQQFLETVRYNFPDVITLPQGMVRWVDFADIWYNASGRVWQKPLKPKLIDRPDTIIVSISLRADNVNDRIVIEAGEGRAFDFDVNVLTSEGIQTFEVSVSGDGDRIPVSVSGRVQAIIPGSSKHAAVILEEDKNMDLWLNQLRAEELDSADRVAAARAIAEYDDDPDLELLLRDVLNRVEGDADITAEIYRTLGKITAGASGVQRLFLQGLEHDNELVRNASLESLQYYHGDEEIIEAVFDIISGSDDINYVNRAIPVYGKLIEQEEYQEFIGQFLQEDVDLEFTKTLLNELFTLSDADFVVERGEAYLSSRYPFALRYQAFQHVLEYDDSRSRWRERQQNLSNDSDPRMRYLILTLASDDGNLEVLRERLDKEYDERIISLIRNELN